MKNILLNPRSGDFIVLAAGKFGRKIERIFKEENGEGSLVEIRYDAIRSKKMHDQTNRIMSQLLNRTNISQRRRDIFVQN